MSGASMPIELLGFKHIGKGAVVGVASVKLGRALKINDIMVLTSNGRQWANLPARQQIGKDGTVIKDDRGKPRYTTIIEWADPESRERFSAAVISAIEAEHGPIASLVGGAR
jgi:hypothetical protein